MSVTTFLTNEDLWRTLQSRLKAARHVEAAIAYFGKNGAKLLPLRRGDRLIVDMSLSIVEAGGTDPREIEKLLDRGVQVFTRRNLHAKVVLADNHVISGSANISGRAKELLDEAGILTNDRNAVRRAREFIGRVSLEPIRPEYLEECKRCYRPPKLKSQRTTGKQRQQRVKHAKLWMVNLREYEVPESELRRYEEGEAKARQQAQNAVRSTAASFHWPSKPRMASELELGDWILRIMKKRDGTILVYPPGQFLLTDHYTRDLASRKERWVFHLEIPRQGQAMTWDRFVRSVRTLPGLNKLKTPRSCPVRDVYTADQILALWTVVGRISRR